MNFGLFEIMMVLGALGLFIFGMKVLSEGIQKIAGHQLRQAIRAMTSNRFVGLLSGLAVTALIQSSSATTVMAVSFVNAGLMSLAESIGVIMGANIGTTITGWLVAIEMEFSLAEYALIIVAVAAPLMFFNRSQLRNIAEFLIGFALMFLALSQMRTVLPDLKNNPEFMAFIQGVSGDDFASVAIGLGVGLLFTAIVQSSSAAMVLTFVLCATVNLPLEMGMGMVLGENIGTTVTANLAALVANVHAKRAALSHTLFNVLGLVWIIPLFLPITYGLKEMISTFGLSVPVGLALFHTSFNVVNSLILINFVPLIASASKAILRARNASDEKFHLEYLRMGPLVTAELSLVEANRELANFGEITKRMLGFVRDQLTTTDQANAKQLISRIRKYEKITDRIEVEIGDYLLKIAERDLSESASLRVRSMLGISDELERIADRILQMSRNLERKMQDQSWFTPQQRNSMIEMFDLLDEAFDIMIENLNKDYSQVDTEEAGKKEKEINSLRNKLRTKHMKSIERNDYNIKSGLIYTELFSASERVGDHILNVTEAATGQV